MSEIGISTKTIDHIVHLTPPGSVEETSEQFRKLGFKVIPGGTHTDGLTANALVVLADGVYVELICFTNPLSHYPPDSPDRRKRDENPWSHMSYGWVDYAFLGNGSHTTRISDIINDRAQQDGSGAFYAPEIDGGRQRPDGKILKWLITAPETKLRGSQPFFCGDVTSRDWRVPSEPPSNMEHPSTASGIASVRILTDLGSLAVMSRQLTSVIGDAPLSLTDSETVWVLDTPRHSAPRLILSVPTNDNERDFIGHSGSGIYEVAFRVSREKGKGSATTPYGKIAWVPGDD